MHVYIHTTTDKYDNTFITEVTSTFDEDRPNWEHRVYGRGWINYVDAKRTEDKWYYVCMIEVDDGPHWSAFPIEPIKDNERRDWGTKENPMTKAEFDAAPRSGVDCSVDPAPGFANLTRVFEGIQQTLALPLSDSSKVQVIEAIIRDDKLSYGYRGE